MVKRHREKGPVEQALYIFFGTLVLFFIVKASVQADPDFAYWGWGLFASWCAGAGWFLKKRIFGK